jgi:Ulp1 family protease
MMKELKKWRVGGYEEITKVFIPVIIDGDHWMLALAETYFKEITIFDSLDSKKFIRAAKRNDKFITNLVDKLIGKEMEGWMA